MEKVLLGLLVQEHILVAVINGVKIFYMKGRFVVSRETLYLDKTSVK
jgi:hypothetical protein